jgi:uncharacterized membrane protein YhfC
MKGKLGIYVGLSILLLALAGCAAADQPSPTAGASVSGTRQEEAAGSADLLAVQVEQADEPIGVDFRGVVSGTVRAQMADAAGTAIWQAEVGPTGPFAVNTVVEPPTAGEYQLGLAWDGPMQIQYALQWKPGRIEVPTISPLALMAGVGMVVVAVGFVVYTLATHQMNWKYLGLGALAWIVAVFLKFLWAVPVNPVVYDFLTRTLPEAVGLPIYELYVGALTGVFEVALVWLAMRYSRLGQGVTWKGAFSFGVGFGSLEALLLGVSSAASVIAALTTPDIFPLETLTQIAQASNPLYGLAPVVERFFTILVHIFANVLIFYAVAKKQPRWFWVAFAYKTLIDALAAFGQVMGLDTLATLWAIEAFVVIWGAIGWLGIRWIKGQYPETNR